MDASNQVNWIQKDFMTRANMAGDGKFYYVSGAQVVDLDYDGDQDLVVFRGNGGYTEYHMNGSAIDHGTSIILNIRDKNGINAFYGNTVALIDEVTGQVVATQIINAQSGVNTQNSTGLVYFYGLDATKLYSAVLLSNGNDFGGVSTITLGANIIENVNASWAGLKAVEKYHAYYLSAENGDAASNSATAATDATNTTGFVGTGYNDTFFATAGTHVYNGAGGTTIVSNEVKWSGTGGIDIVDYKLAGSTAINVDLSNTAEQDTGFGKATFKNIEGIAGSNSADIFTDNANDNFFEGRGGNDTFNLLQGGQDTLIYKLLNANDTTGGNGTDVVNGFKVGVVEATLDADIIDLKDLLISYQADADGAAHYINGVAAIDAGDTIEQFLKVEQEGNNTVIKVDRDGEVGGHDFTTLVTLNDVQTDLATLLANHQIVIG